MCARLAIERGEAEIDSGISGLWRPGAARYRSGCDNRPLAQNASSVRHGDHMLMLKRVQLSVSELAIMRSSRSATSSKRLLGHTD